MAMLCTALLAIPGTAFSRTPRGIFSIATSGRPINASTLTNANVDGITLKQAWFDLEKTDNVFDFTYLDTEVAKAAAARKIVLLRVMTMTGRPAWVDTAIRQAGGKFFTWSNQGVNTTIPVFWDPTFLAKKKAMITALGAHFANNPTVAVVVASFANAVTEDWNLPHTQTPVDLVAQWLSLGYTTANMLSAGQQIIDTTMAAFPNASVTLAVSGDGDYIDNNGQYKNGGAELVPRGAVDAARLRWPGRLIVQKNDLSVCIPEAPGTDTIYDMMWDYRPDTGGQMLFTIYNDPTHRVACGSPLILPDDQIIECVTNAVAYGEKFVEIYEGDCNRYPVGMTAAHILLLGH